jgi:predicted amidophosphoribosyltransferase
VSLILCRLYCVACANQVSDQAPACPRCGQPISNIATKNNNSSRQNTIKNQIIGGLVNGAARATGRIVVSDLIYNDDDDDDDDDD